MNPKVIKLKEEHEKNSKKIVSLKARNKKIEELVTELENNDIIGMVREFELSPDQLMELLCMMKKTPLPDDSFERTEENPFEEQN